MINTSDLGKIAFFPEKDQKKIDNQPSFFTDSGSFLSALQVVSEETRENSHTNTTSTDTEGQPQSKINEISGAETKEAEPHENYVSPSQKSEIIDEKSTDGLVANDSILSNESVVESEKSLTITTKTETGKDEKNANKLSEITGISNGAGIATMLMPSFQKEMNGLEIFQDKLLSGNAPYTQTPKNLFPKKSDQKDTGDLLKSIFDIQKKIPNEKDTSSKEKIIKDNKESKEVSSLSTQNVKQMIDDLKIQPSKSPKVEEKFMDFSKSLMSSSFLEQVDFDGLNDKKARSHKKKSEDTKGLNLSEKKGNEINTPEKNNNKDQIFTHKNLKEENNITTISDKLKRTEMNQKRDKVSEIIPENKNEIHVEVKTTEKNSPSTLIFESKQKLNDSKLEVKSVQKPDSLGQNFKEIVKAAKFHIVENGKNTAEISLQPKDLGKLTLYVSEENNRLEGKITVENESVRQMILGELANLKADLKAGGLDLFEIQVDLQQEMNQPFAQGEEYEERPNSRSYSEYSEGLPSEEDSQGQSLDNSTSRLLDLKV